MVWSGSLLTQVVFQWTELNLLGGDPSNFALAATGKFSSISLICICLGSIYMGKMNYTGRASVLCHLGI